MVIQHRLGGAVSILPAFLVLIIGRMFQIQIIIDASFVVMIIGVIFSGKIYDFFFLDSNSTSSLYAGNLAIQYGYEPKGQNGEIWNPNGYKISEIYKLYPKKRFKSPEPGSAGFLFYTNKKGLKANRMEFYDYRLGGAYFVDYEFYFHPEYDRGDETTRKEVSIENISDRMVFVPLEKF